MENIYIENMNWPQVQSAISGGFKNIVAGVGSIEQHGPHLPLKTDALIGDIIAFMFAEKLGNALVAPAIRVGCSDHHLYFSGTISLKPDTFKLIISDYVRSLQKYGFKNIIFLPSHGGNFSPLEQIVNDLKIKYKNTNIIAFTDIKSYMDIQYNTAKKFGISAEEGGAHAGEIETSIMLYLVKTLSKSKNLLLDF